jgi:hypothetical protein
MRVGRSSSLLIAFFVAWTAAPAVAQWAVTPYLGVNVGGDVETGKGSPGVESSNSKPSPPPKKPTETTSSTQPRTTSDSISEEA